MGITVDEIVHIALYTGAGKTFAEIVGSALAVIMGNDHAAHHKTTVRESLAQTQHILIVSDAEIGADLVLHNVLGTDDYHYLYLVAKLGKHAQLRIGPEAWQHPAGMVVVKQLPAEFQIQLPAEFLDTLPDMLRLDADILLIVKPLPHRILHLL